MKMLSSAQFESEWQHLHHFPMDLSGDTRGIRTTAGSSHPHIAVAGTGYMGLSIATLLVQHHQVIAVDVISDKVDLINRRKSPIQDDYIEKYLAEKDLNLTTTLDEAKAYSEADFVVIAAPTNYDPVKNYFDTNMWRK